MVAIGWVAAHLRRFGAREHTAEAVSRNPIISMLQVIKEVADIVSRASQHLSHTEPVLVEGTRVR